ncbi:hypothetical protein PP175_21265 [Aneurinibacillus sp. Ricciae_BoGa-3]|uniref:hypothetical protein n=1 Tax=Aneurinibacillus sp. Ricciae_BoGa-3 TaxID=3022697 RepID=UPI00234164D5|nr:hypothetical protein [Aneurinibacillus sp. Ricciae_BoGa-3]WCK53821.1 hypothetical protein PP175_21265 [Aneurinibacillus sp. Ricciae_BoGa-3]
MLDIALGLNKTEYGFVLFGVKDDYRIDNADCFIKPVWKTVEQEARKMVERTANLGVINFRIKSIENHPTRGTVAHFSCVYIDGMYTEGTVPIEQCEESFLELLKDLKNIM